MVGEDKKKITEKYQCLEIFLLEDCYCEKQKFVCNINCINSTLPYEYEYDEYD
jgi:hypothetical protein